MSGIFENARQILQNLHILRQRGYEQINMVRPLLNMVARARGYNFEPGTQFAIDLTKEPPTAYFDMNFYVKEQGYTPEQSEFALLHEIRCHLVEKDKLQESDEGKAAYEERRVREEQVDWLHIWENCRTDAAGNWSILLEISPALQEAAESLYKDKLFASRDFRKMPRHLQFCYAVLVEKMLPSATDVQVVPEVREAIDRLKNTSFVAPDGQVYQDALEYVTRPDRLWDSGKVRRRMIMTKVIRNLPPPLSYPFSYGRDAIIIPGPSVMTDGDGGRVVWSIFTSPVNGIPRVSAWRHRRGFKKALDKRQQLMMDVLQKHQGAYSVDTWNSMAKSFNDLTTLSNQSGRQRLDNYWDDYGFEAEWQWTPDATLVSMLANRFPKLQTREEINTIWRTVFETRSLLRRQDIGQKEFKTKLTNELCNVLLNSKDTNAVSQARKYLTVLLTRNNSGTTELDLYATAQNAAAVRSKLTT